MHVAVIGINHKSAPLSLQEKVARACALRLSLESPLSAELSCVVLSTCNRSEIYFVGEEIAQTHSFLLALLREEIDEPFEHRVYTYFGVDCFAHLATVIAGWDSLVLGETQIHRQVRMAYENAKLHYKLKSPIHYLFQKSLKIAKNIRSRSSQRFQSLPEILWRLTEEILGALAHVKILLVGNSEMNRKLLTLFHDKRLKNLTLVTRAPLSAQDLCKKFPVTIKDWSELSLFGQYDLVICSTHAGEYLIKDSGASCNTKLIIDLSVPRVVDPKLSEQKSLCLWNMEQIGMWMKQDLTGIVNLTGEIRAQVEKYTTLFSEKTVCI